MTSEPRAEETVELWRGRDGLWAYRFVPPEGRPIDSNRSFPDRREAESAAALAYPGVAREVLRGVPVLGVEDVDRTWRIVMLVVGALTLGVGYVLLKVVLVLRRVWKKAAGVAAVAGAVAEARRTARRDR
jgi:hypothetical protein